MKGANKASKGGMSSTNTKPLASTRSSTQIEASPGIPVVDANAGASDMGATGSGWMDGTRRGFGEGLPPRRSTPSDRNEYTAEKNLTQMVKSLKSRVTNLQSKMSLEKELLEEDIKVSEDGQERGVKDLPKIVNDADEEVPRSIRELRGYGHGKGNLVSSDTVFIDPYHLVLKSKAPTDAARKIEAIFQGTTNNRDPKTKKAKAAGHSEQSKKEEQLKNETKRNNRIRLERKLQQITESFVTRNVNDKIFEVPDIATEEPKWAVTIKWSHRDPRSASPENAEGEFDPDLLMKYALEMIQLPSGRKLFTWLIRQLTLQRYFVYLFWLIKVKFFETDYVDEKEVYLLRLLSLEYRQIVEMLASRAHAEHEKDFVFKYLPFILTNAVYYGFFYIFPGSRHSTNTRAFKKTVYMQVVQIMHGFQVCPISVKVSWAKLFPEDVLDGDGSGGNADSEGGNNGTGGTTGVAGDGMRHGIGGAGGGAAEDGKEVFPVPFALKASKLSAIHGTASQPRRGSNQQQQHRPGTGDNGMQTTPSPSSLKRKGSVLAGSRPGSPAGGPAPLTVNWDNDSLSSPSPPQRNLQRARSSRTGVGFEGAGSAPSSPTGRLSNGVSRLRFDSPPVSRGLSRTRSSMGNISGIFSVTDDSVSTADGDGRGGGRGSKGGSLQRSSTSNNLNNRNDDDNASLAATIDPFSEENVEQTVLQMLTRTGSVLARHASVSKLASQRSLSHLNVLPPRHGHQNSNKSLRRQASQRSGASSSSMLQRQGTASSLHLPAGGSAALAVTNVHANNVSHASLIGEGDDEGVGHGHADELHIHTATTGSDGNRRMSHNQLLHPLQTTTIVDNDEDLEGQQTVLLSTQELAADPRFNQSVLRTYLKAAPLKPPNIAQAKRQGVVEKINAQQISPQMTLLLAQIKPSGNVDTNAFAQTVRRTIPVSWAPAGGTDTHHRTVVATELHHEISQKMKKAREEYIQIGVESHKTKLNEKARLNKELDKILQSGPTTISRYSLDLIRQHKNARLNGGVVASITSMINGANANGTATNNSSTLANGNGGNGADATTNGISGDGGGVGGGGNGGGNGGGGANNPGLLLGAEEMDLATLRMLANYDDDEVERFLASC